MRSIRTSEYEFVRGLFAITGLAADSFGLSQSLFVEELDDGGMGSLRFQHSIETDPGRSLGQAVVQGQFKDRDGVIVDFTVNVDKSSRLFELDLWKVDFSPLKAFPTSSDIFDVRLVV